MTFRTVLTLSGLTLAIIAALASIELPDHPGVAWAAIYGVVVWATIEWLDRAYERNG